MSHYHNKTKEQPNKNQMYTKDLKHSKTLLCADRRRRRSRQNFGLGKQEEK